MRNQSETNLEYLVHIHTWYMCVNAKLCIFTCDAKGKKWYFPCSSYLFRYAGKKTPSRWLPCTGSWVWQSRKHLDTLHNFHACMTIERFRFPRWREFWTRDITSSCVMWRHAFNLKFRRSKQTWKQSFWGWPLTCGHDVTFGRSRSGKRLSKPP